MRAFFDPTRFRASPTKLRAMTRDPARKACDTVSLDAERGPGNVFPSL
jgi:hypothetical protein